MTSTKNPPRLQVPSADPDHHWSNLSSVDRSIVLGFKSRFLKSDIPNQMISEYVGRNPQKLIGFAGIDPIDRAAPYEVKVIRNDLKLRGVTLSPANQDFHPTDTRAMRVYAECEKLNLPIFFHPGGQLTEQSKLEFSRPFLLDEVARSFPGLKLVIGRMGWPWVDETIYLLGKHGNVYADITGIMARPWLTYNALVNAFQSGVIDKLLFGSDFPYADATDCIEAIYNINQMAQGTNLPVVPRESLRGIVERETLSLLGIE